ncbi:MAG: mechanosensitive ion channel domain-containing protein [Candidatus Woesearchaeota archaeon]
MISLTGIKDFMQYNLGTAIMVIAILLATIVIARLVKRFVLTKFEKSSKSLKVDHTQFIFLRHFFTAMIYIIGIGIAVYTIPSFKNISLSLFASAGVLAVVIGFASQKAVSNIIGGIFIAIFRPFRVGDIVKFSDRTGVVEDINLRHTIIRNFENKRIIVPNAIISEEVIENYNINDEKICRFVEFGISYDSDVDKAMRIMQQEAMKHPDFLDNRSEEDKKEGKPAVEVRVLGFGDSSVNLRAWVWAKNSKKAFRLGCDLNKSIKKSFDKAGIEIPFPYRTIVFKGRARKRKS